MPVALFFAALFFVIQGMFPNTNSATNSNGLSTIAYSLIGIFLMSCVAIQSYCSYRKDWYNPNLALKYQDLFEGEPIRKARAAAANQFKADKKYNGKTKEIETVLDVFEDIGFYVKHHEISDEVAHHHFYYWIVGYIQTASEYIAEYRREDPTTYEHCEWLMNAVLKVEAKKLKCQTSELMYSEKDIADFIEEEAASA